VKDALLKVMRASGWPVTLSMGVVTFPQADKSAEEMLNAADNTMYSAKAQGKNRIQYAIQPASTRAASFQRQA